MLVKSDNKWFFGDSGMNLRDFYNTSAGWDVLLHFVIVIMPAPLFCCSNWKRATRNFPCENPKLVKYRIFDVNFIMSILWVVCWATRNLVKLIKVSTGMEAKIKSKVISTLSTVVSNESSWNEKISPCLPFRDKVAGNCEIPPQAPLVRKPI